MRPLTVSDQLAAMLTGDFRRPVCLAATESGRDYIAVLTSVFLYVFCFLFFSVVAVVLYCETLLRRKKCVTELNVVCSYGRC